MPVLHNMGEKKITNLRLLTQHRLLFCCFNSCSSNVIVTSDRDKFEAWTILSHLTKMIGHEPITGNI